MIQNILTAAETVGIAAIVTNSEERLQTQLNNITREEHNPIMLVSWDIVTKLVFDDNGLLENPSADITVLLVKKPEDTTRSEALVVAEQMAALYTQFLIELRKILIQYQRSITPPISNATYKLVPIHGAGKHSGVLGKWTMRTDLNVCTGA